MEDRGECSASAKPSDEIWAKLVPSDSRYSDVEITSDEKVICSEISATLSDKHSWCKIVRNSDLCSATMENKSPNTILVDGREVCNDNTIVIKDGSEIITGPDKGFVSYKFHLMSSPETCQRQLKICVDVENANCSICLNIWHDVVTISPCLHNFCNGCFSEWLRRSQKKHSSILCPQCRAVVQYVRRNPFLRTIAEDMVRADSSLRRSDEEIALLDTRASVRSNLAEQVPGAGPVHMDQAGGSGGDEEEETDSEDHDDEEEEEDTNSETDYSLTSTEDQSDEEETDSSEEGVPGAQPAEEQPVPPPPTTSMSQLDSMLILMTNIQQQQQLQRQELLQQTAYLNHICVQQAANHRAFCAFFESSYRSSLQQGSPSPYRWPTPEDFAARVAWPGDRPTFEEEEVSSHGAGAGAVNTDQAGGSAGDEEETHSKDQDNEEEETHA